MRAKGGRCGLMTAVSRILAGLLFILVLYGPAPAAQTPQPGAEVLKTNLLFVGAHPDDETGCAATLARYAVGKGLAVAGVYCTRGEGGGNMVGTQSGRALGLLRAVE